MNRNAEMRPIMLGFGIVCALAAACSVWPALDAWLTVLVLVVVGTPVAGYLTREALRELRFRRDMRALDRRDATRAANLVGGPR